MEKITLQSPLGLIAGNGAFPIEFVQNARARSLGVVVLAHIGETDPQIEKIATRCVWVKFGQLGRIIDVFLKNGVKQAALAGGIRRVNLFGGVKFDLTALGVIARLASRKDDSALRGIAAEIERHGITIIPANLLLEQSVPKAGLLSKRELSADELKDALVGFEAAREIGKLDIGQTVVVNQGLITAVEAIEGTDLALKRAGELARGKGGVVVKLCKPQQDLRFDLPTVGPKTIELMRLGGLTAIVLEAGRSLMLDPVEVIRCADAAKIAVLAVEAREGLLR